MNIIIPGIMVMLVFLIFHLGAYVYATCSIGNGTQDCSPRIDILVSKPSYVSGGTIQITGFYLPNTIIHVDLIDPSDKIKNSTLLQSDNLGNFQKKFVTPSDAVNGTWKINATSGPVHTTRYITVISLNHQNKTSSADSFFTGHLMPPLRALKSGVFINDINCSGNRVLIIKSEDGSPACVKPQTAQRLVGYGWGAVSLGNNMHADGSNFSVNYSITNATVLGIRADIQSKSIIVSIKTTGDGQLTMDIPRALIDAKTNDKKDDQFYVLDNGQEVVYAETKTSTDRTLTVLFTSDIEEIEFIASSIT